MNKSHLMAGALALAALLGAASLMPKVLAATPASPPAPNDQTLDLAEVKAAAGAHFDRLDKDAVGTLNSKEVEGIIAQKTFKSIDADNDGTLTKDEYLSLVERLFNTLDTDHDGTLSVQELKTNTARQLKLLID